MKRARGKQSVDQFHNPMHPRLGRYFALLLSCTSPFLWSGWLLAAPSTKPVQSSIGDSLTRSLLGADALRSQTSPSNTPSNAPPKTTANNFTPASAPIQVAQASSFPDIQGNWAQTFIEALAQRNVIRGFPDGTFRPNEPVTRAQFAAMVRQAFAKNPIRQAQDFVDVPARYWGYEAIQAAYRTGFLEGYPNQVFQPEQNIPRVQVLVSLISGLELSPQGNVASILGNTYQDASNIPTYAQTAVAAATENQIVVNFPNVALLNPNQIATRADVAAFIYQALVRSGQLPAVQPTNVAARYIVGYQPPNQAPGPLTAEQVAALRQQYRLPEPPIVEELRRIFGGGSSIATPTAFGADRQRVFLGASYQARTRGTNISDGGIVAGIGVGDARKAVGLEAALSIYDLRGDGAFQDGGISFKVHRLFPDDLAVAVGVENFDQFGNPDPAYSSAYGVVSKVIPLGRPTTVNQFVPSVTASVGLGGGRFRSEADIRAGRTSVNPFGSVGVRVAEPISLVAEWSGQDLNLGASIAPIPRVPLIITPAVVDVTGNAGDGARFVLGVGYGFSF